MPSENRPKIRIAIVGAGVSGLAVANGLLRDASIDFDVQIYERDSIAFSSERGGYQLRISADGLNALNNVTDIATRKLLDEIWDGKNAKAPTIVDPRTFEPMLKLADVKLYPQSRAIPRSSLRRALLQKPMAQDRVHFNHKFDRYEISKDESQRITLHFDNHPPAYADILIAADGSNSRINQQVGMNNKIKLQQWTLIQARSVIDQAIYNQLSPSLIEVGSVIIAGGDKISGFANVYKNRSTDKDEDFTLYWSLLIPSSIGEKILVDSGSDEKKTVRLLLDYLRDKVKLEKHLPFIIQSAPDHLRTGKLTSSFKPLGDWRADKPLSSRIILLGDAIHCMTPGRGQGANQSLIDAGNLVTTLRAIPYDGGVISQPDMTTMVRAFDKEMYDRAFDMVAKSEQVTNLDVTVLSGKIQIVAAKVILTLLGWIVSLFEFLRLKRKTSLGSLSLVD